MDLPRDSEKRRTLRQLAGMCALPLLPAGTLAGNDTPLRRTIPATGEAIPTIGMGSWLTFDVPARGQNLKTRIDILRHFFAQGGQMIDSSPMYGQSEEVIGACLEALAFPQACFSATKVWTSGKDTGIRQMQHSAELWKLKQFRLMQIHNLVDWETHMKTLLAWKEKGQLDYVGITTYGGLRHETMARIMRHYPIDFVQLTYNILDREAEATLLPLAQEKGIAVIANRPFREGRLFDYIRNKPLPESARALNCANWAQYFLKFILAHPAITCAIPATSKLAHMQENMGALYGPLPAQKHQQKLAKDFQNLI